MALSCKNPSFDLIRKPVTINRITYHLPSHNS